MKTKIAITVVALMSTIAFTNAQTPTTKSATPNRGEAAVVSTEVKAKVKDIDYKTRKVKLETMDGKVYDIVAGDRIKNLDQVKKGDTVVADYTESMVYEIKKGGKATALHETTVAESARPGSKPESTMAREVSASVIISAIDQKTPSVTFKKADGETQTFKVKHPERLQGLKVGDRVDITYTEALALRVEKASKM